MSWVRIEVDMPDHIRIQRAGVLAFAMHVAAICYAARNLTDGYIPPGAPARLLGLDELEVASGENLFGRIVAPARATDIVAALEATGLWTPDPSGGWWIRDYLDYQELGDKARAARSATSIKRSIAGKARARKAARDGDGRYLPNPRGPVDTHGARSPIAPEVRATSEHNRPAQIPIMSHVDNSPGEMPAARELGASNTTLEESKTRPAAVDKRPAPRPARAADKRRARAFTAARNLGRTRAGIVGPDEILEEARRQMRGDPPLIAACMDSYNHASAELAARRQEETA